MKAVAQMIAVLVEKLVDVPWVVVEECDDRFVPNLSTAIECAKTTSMKPDIIASKDPNRRLVLVADRETGIVPNYGLSAILTKYTSLRSFHEKTTKGSPLDYENAGVYTAALYDAYSVSL